MSLDTMHDLAFTGFIVSFIWAVVYPIVLHIIDGL